MQTDRRRGVAAALVLALALTTACARDDTAEHDNHAGQPPQGPATAEVIMPYGAGFEHLQNQPPEAVAETALLRLAHATPAQIEDPAAAVQLLRGVVTPELWRRLIADPAAVVPFMTGPAWRAWDSAGGGVQATVRQDTEQHPPDTADTWARKFTVTRQLAGDASLKTTYIVGLRQLSGQWRVDDLRLL
jgi:hypothetical protein